MNRSSLKLAVAAGVNSVRHLIILETLGRQGGTQLNHLAAELDVTTPAITQAVDTLARNGLVERRYSRDDRRKIEAVLSERGHQLLNDIATVEAVPATA